MPTAISTSVLKYYTAPNAVVAYSATLRDQDFVTIPYLYCSRLALRCAPEVDEAVLTYDYGPIIQSRTNSLTTYAPLSLVGYFVRITISDTVTGSGALPPIVWYGYVEPETLDVRGNGRGEQTLIAYGLLRLLEVQKIQSSFVEQQTGSTSYAAAQLNRGLTFNNDDGGEFVRRGNMNSNMINGSFVFSWKARKQTEWDAYNAVLYVLNYFTPKQADGTVANKWVLNCPNQYLNWFPITEGTDGHTVKELLDRLIPRSRGVGYYVGFDASLDGFGFPKNQVTINVFTFNSSDIALPNGLTLKANNYQKSLDFENALDIDHAIVTNVGTTSYHRITARGARRTTTFTTRLQANRSGSYGSWGTTWSPWTVMSPRWPASQEDEYATAAYGSSGYFGLSDVDKKAANAAYRSSDRLRAVWRRYGLNMQTLPSERWNGIVVDPHSNGGSSASFGSSSGGGYCDVAFDGSPTSVNPYHSTRSPLFNESVPVVRLLRSLPLYHGVDYSGSISPTIYPTDQEPSFISTFAYAMINNGTGSPADDYELVEQLDRVGKTWNCSVSVADTEPAIIIEAPVPHFISTVAPFPTSDSAQWGISADEHDSDQSGGIPYTNLWVTVCVELSERISTTISLSNPTAGAPIRELVLDYPDARFDYVLPWTVVEIRNQNPVQTAGGAVADDRVRLQTMANAAAVWFGQNRQSLDLKFKQVRALFSLGDLITTISTLYDKPNINTPITAITYEMGHANEPGSTQLQTAFGTIDLSQVRRIAPAKPKAASTAMPGGAGF